LAKEILRPDVPQNLLFAFSEKGNPSAKRNFLKILGSNPILKDRNLLFSTKKPYSLDIGRSPCHKKYFGKETFIFCGREAAPLGRILGKQARKPE
jgi:hypothetical protein